MKKKLSIILSLLLALSVFLPTEVFAEGNPRISYDVTYGQEAARSMLELVNEFRASDEAWYWNSDNKTKTVCDNLKPLKYDYTLEKAAEKRAAEAAIYFSHTRPDGSSRTTMAAELGLATYDLSGENLAIISRASSASEALELLKETDEDYSGQGHRRLLLSSSFVSIGIGHANFRGVDCWVQVFGRSEHNGTETAAREGASEYTTSVVRSQVWENALSCPVSEITVAAGESTKLPELNSKFIQYNSSTGSGTFPYTAGRTSYRASVRMGYTASVADSDVAVIKDGSILGKEMGETTLIITPDIADVSGGKLTGTGKSFKVNVTVTGDHVLSDWQVTKKAGFDSSGTISRFCTEEGCSYKQQKTIQPLKVCCTSAYTYSGKVITPSVTVKDAAGNSVTASKTYASGRKNVGTYSVRISVNSDKYQGTRTVYFRINPKGARIKTPSATRGAFTAKWYKQSGRMSSSRVTGYQVQYSKSSKFTSAKTVTVKGYSKTSKKIRNLAKKTRYYIRVRTYMKTGGSTYYSTWSSMKSVKTR